MIPTSLLTLGVLADGARLIEAAIVASVNNPNVPALLTAAGWDGDAAEIVLTIDSGVKVGSASPATPAMVLPAFPAKSVVTLVNNGKIIGAGGRGGQGAPLDSGRSGEPGQVGGTALRVWSAITVQNNGEIYGGGGGGGGDGSTGAGAKMGGWNGGTGAGIVAIPTIWTNGHSEYLPNEFRPETRLSGGPGDGGGPGKPGRAGVANTKSAGAGGAAGFYIVGNNHVTWSVTGSRLGRVGS